MTHQECQELLLGYAYGELGRRETGEVAAHLSRCSACAGVYRRIAGVREVMGRLEPEPPPGQGERLILAAAREAAGRRREARPWPGLAPWAWKASAAALVLAAVAGVSVKIATLRERSAPEEHRVAVPVGPASEERARVSDASRAAEPPPRATTPARRAPAREPPAAEALAAKAPVAKAPVAGRPGAASAPAAVAEAADAGREEAAFAQRAPERPAGGAARPAVSGLPSGEAAAAGPEVAGARAQAGRQALRAARGVVQDVERRLASGQLVESARPFQACGPAEDAERRLYARPDGRVVKYVRQSGSAEAALTFEQYYDGEGRLRHVFIHGGAVTGAVVEHRIWFAADGSRLREEQRFRRGRYPFPETWPDDELDLRAPDASALRCGAP